MKLARLCFAFFFMVPVFGCTDHTALARQAGSKASQHLIGTWDVRFHLDRPLLVSQQAGPKVRDVSGQLAFLANRWVDRSYPAMSSPTDYGTFDIDFNPFGFDPRIENETPTVEAWLGNDSLQVLIGDPTGDITVRMGGRVVGDSVRGEWTALISRTAGGGGQFLMVRHK